MQTLTPYQVDDVVERGEEARERLGSIERFSASADCKTRSGREKRTHCTQSYLSVRKRSPFPAISPLGRRCPHFFLTPRSLSDATGASSLVVHAMRFVLFDFLACVMQIRTGPSPFAMIALEESLATHLFNFDFALTIRVIGVKSSNEGLGERVNEFNPFSEVTKRATGDSIPPARLLPDDAVSASTAPGSARSGPPVGVEFIAGSNLSPKQKDDISSPRPRGE